MPYISSNQSRAAIKKALARIDDATPGGFATAQLEAAENAIFDKRAAVLHPGHSNVAGLMLSDAINMGKDIFGRGPEDIITWVIRERGIDAALDTIDRTIPLNKLASVLLADLRVLALDPAEKMSPWVADRLIQQHIRFAIDDLTSISSYLGLTRARNHLCDALAIANREKREEGKKSIYKMINWINSALENYIPSTKTNNTEKS